MSDPGPVRVEVGDGVARIVLDSPHNRNALSTRLVDALDAALAAAFADPGVRVVVLTHAGGTFCAGADLAETAAAPSAAAVADRAERLIDVLRALLAGPKPVVGRVDGHVRAGGMGLVGACDLVLASPRASFGLTEVRLGLAAAAVSLTVLPRLSDRAAAHLLLTGAIIDAAQATRIGLITRSADDVDGAVEAVVADLRAGSPQGLRESKALLNRAILRSIDADRHELARCSGDLFASAEAAEGMRAFRDRRPPAWAR